MWVLAITIPIAIILILGIGITGIGTFSGPRGYQPEDKLDLTNPPRGN